MRLPKEPTTPQLYVLRASSAARAVVFVSHRRKRWSLHLWDLDARHVERGGVFFGTLYPRRCDLSPDGRYLLYFAMKAPGAPAWPWQFSALSRAPWLACLLAWREAGTWTSGMHFCSRSSGRPEIPDRQYLHHVVESADRCPWNIEKTARMGLAAERRIGFVEAEDSPAPCDQPRRVLLHKRRPGGGREGLELSSSPFGESDEGIEGTRNLYALRREDGREIALPEHGWLDWLDHDHVYGTTRDGRLVVCTLRGDELVETWSHAFGRMPSRKPAPAWARGW